MAVRKLTSDIFYVGSIDWDRRIFDELIPLPDGTSYNAYLIKGSEKTALIDSVDPEKEMELLGNLHEIGVDKIDYIVTNHAEQDHSGAIPLILEHFPEAVVVTNQKCKNFEVDHLYIPDSKFKIIHDGDTLSLGNKTLKFIMTPWVHWPETMVTYLEEDKMLFSCDFFGSHFATSKIYAEDNPKVIEGAKRYYAEIMMPFRATIRKNIEKLSDLNIEMIAPSHGPIWKHPETIVNSYKEWISEKVENEVVIPFVSMHESTRIMVDYLIDELIKKDIIVKPFNLTKTDTGDLAMSLVDTATVIVATPMVLAGAHPAAVYATFLMNALRPKTKFVGIIGSYGWGGKMVDQLKGLLGNLKVEFFDPVLVKGRPVENDFEELDKLVEQIVENHKNLNKE